MESIASLLALLMLQAAYGPPTPPPAPSQAHQPAAQDTPSDVEALLRAQGMSQTGLAALRGLPMPRIARGATRAAQCTVEQLGKRSPLPLDELASALEERDATAAEQARETTHYLLAALARLQPADQRILLAVVGTGAVGGPPPPPLRDQRAAAGRPGPGGPGGRGGPGGGMGGPGGGMGGPGGPPPGGPRMAGRGDAPPPPAGASPGPVSACEHLLDG